MHANTMQPRRTLFFPCVFIFALLLGLSTRVSAQELVAQDIGDTQKWELTADRIAADQDNNIVEAFGDVRLTSGTNYLRADYAKYYHDTGWIELEGDVEARWNDDILKAKEASFDLKNQIGWLRDGLIFVSGPHLYFRGEEIQKESKDTYSFKEAEITACDNEPAAWSIAASEGAITVDGYATLKHAKFRVKDQPVLYSPYFIIPAKRSRQSGFLFPEIGSSSRLGVFVNQPYYWAINDESDATFYENFMSDRGLMQGVEYRHTHDPETKGVWKFDWFHDSETAGNEQDEDDQFDDDGLVRSNKVRYWWRSKLDTHLADPEWLLKVDIDYVSDQNYLREFSDGLSGFDASDAMFLEEFRRDLLPSDELERTSSAVLFKSWNQYGFAARADYTQNLAHMNGNRDKNKNDSVQVLPEITGYKYKDKLFSSPFEFEMDASAANFARVEGASGGRLDAMPRLSLPMNFQGVSIIPEASFRETVYAVDTWGNRTRGAHDDDFTTREVPEFNVSAFTGFYKIFDLGDPADIQVAEENGGDSKWTRLKHTIQPRVSYDWRPFVSQSDKPEYDSADRLEPLNEITYSLTNILDRRRETVVFEGQRDEAQPRLATDYLEFFRLRVQQSFDIREADRADERDEYPRRAFSDIQVETSVQPYNYISLNNRTRWSPYTGSVTEHDHFLRLSLPERGHFDFGLDFLEEIDEYKRTREERLRILRLASELSLSDRWSTGFLFRSNLVTGTDLEKTLFAEYRHQCFDLVFTFSQTPYEDRFGVSIKLVGIGL